MVNSMDREICELNAVHRNKDYKSVYFTLDVNDFLALFPSLNNEIYPYEVNVDCGDIYIYLYREV